MRPRFEAILAFTAFAALSACRDKNQPDAYGNFETTEVVISAEASGQLLWFKADEGQPLAHGQLVGVIDTTQLALQQRQLSAQRGAARSHVTEVGQQLDALRVQHEIAERNYERVKRLFAEQAATAQQLDQAERDYRTLGDQITAQDEQIKAQDRQIVAQSGQVDAARAQAQTVRAQVAAADAQINQVAERLRKTDVKNPVAGTVLTTYARAGEMVQPGQPLYRIANLSSVDVRAYVTEPQLARVRLGQAATVTVDAGRNQHQGVQGAVTWISAQAEFTPTPIQTREERADLVYAVKIRVPNENGLLKIGMPADVMFSDAQEAR